MKRILKALCIVVLALWSALAVMLMDVDTQTSTCTLFYLRDTLAKAQGNVLLLAAIGLGLAWLFDRTLFIAFAWRKHDIRNGVLFCLALAFVLTLSPAYRQTDEALSLFATPYHMLLLVLKLVGWFTLLFAAYKALLMRLNKPFDKRWFPTRTSQTPGLPQLRKAFWIYWLLLLLCWMPSWISRFPAAVSDDASRALQQYYGEILVTGDHPYGYTLLLGWVTQIGLWLGSGNLGVGLFAVLQMLLLSGVLAYTLRDMVRSCIPRAAQFAVFCFYAFLPVLYSYAPVIIKDILYSGAFVGYGIVIYHALEDGPACRKRAGWWAAFLLFSVLLLLVRHNGKMVVWPTTILLIFKAWAGMDARHRILQSTLLAVPVVVALAFQLLVVQPKVIAVDSTSDILGVAFQQTARIVRDDETAVTQEDQAAIDRLLHYNQLASVYDPYITDEVRVQYRYFDAVTMKQKIGFVRAWLRLCASHPLDAFHAFWTLSSGYFDPLTDGSVYIQHMTLPSSPKYVQTLAATHPQVIQSLQDRMVVLEGLWRKLPLIGLLNNVGLYPWLLMLCLMLLRRSRIRHLGWALLPSLMTLIACLLSPAFYSCTRYAFPLVYSAPYLLMMLSTAMLRAERHRQEQTNSVEPTADDLSLPRLGSSLS